MIRGIPAVVKQLNESPIKIDAIEIVDDDEPNRNSGAPGLVPISSDEETTESYG